MASNRGNRPLCIGFGKREGRCLNDAGSTHSQLWCQECDDSRRKHITAQMEKISAQPTNKPPAIEIKATLVEAVHGVWDCNVYVDGRFVGGGTSSHGFLDIAADILYGDGNDRLNGYEGVLGELLKERAQ